MEFYWPGAVDVNVTVQAALYDPYPRYDYDDSSSAWFGCNEGSSVRPGRLEHITCAPDCTATAADQRNGIWIEVSAASAGEKLITFNFETHPQRTQTVRFAEPAKMTINRGFAQLPYAMIAGDEQHWRLCVEDEQGMPVLVTGDAVSWTTNAGPVQLARTPSERMDRFLPLDLNSCRTFEVTAKTAGATELEFRLRNEVRREPVTILDPNDIVQGEFRSARTNAPVQAPLQLPYECSLEPSKTIVPWLVGKDGTIAVGGGFALGVDPEGGVKFRRLDPFVELEANKILDGVIYGTLGESGDLPPPLPYVLRRGCEPQDDAGLPDTEDDAGDDASEAEATP